ncbi:hypothetical protein [Candidatus Amarolinea dominans]|uniref:hypothetical protein n=1 Tax=Candidatus Amarolinea dominans TaxID=3140696 RepID=UPI001D32F626|nr:hypothetical protein [Anaerolineae bacterium]
MKSNFVKIITSVMVLALIVSYPVALAGSYHTGITVDGSVTDWNADELVARESTDDSSFGTTNNLDRLFVTWDSLYLYLRVQGEYENSGNNGFVVFLDIEYGGASNSGVDNLTGLTDSTGAVDALVTNPSFDESDSNFKADYATGVFQRSTVSAGSTSDNAGLRGWGGDGGRGGSTSVFAWLTGVAIAITEGTPDEAEFSISWNDLYGAGAGKVPTDAKLGVVVGYGNTPGGTSDETLPTNGGGGGGTFSSIYTVDVDADNDGYPDIGVKTGDSSLADNSTATSSQPNNATTYTSAKTIDGRLDDWHTNEFLGAGTSTGGGESQMRYFLTWDASNIYVAFAGLGSGSGDKFNVLIDTTLANGDPDRGGFAGVQFNNAFEPEYAYQWNGASLNKYQASGTSWSDVSDDGSGSDTNTDPVIVELSIPRSGIGSPSSLGVYLYASNSSDADYDAFRNTPDNISASPLENPLVNTYTMITKWTNLGTGVDVNDADVPLAAALAGFDAAQAGEAIRVSWETVSEIGNLGFNLWRGTSPNAPDVQLNASLIPSQAPGSSQGFSYEWPDSANLVNNTTYYYWLEDVDTAGAITRHGPISATYSAPTAVRLLTADASPALPFALPLTAVGLAALAALTLRRRR